MPPLRPLRSWRAILRRIPRNSTPQFLHPRFQSTSSARIDRVLSRLPKFLHPYTNGLRTAPVSHVVAFLILHEITAIVPLVGLAGAFHYTEWLPKSWSEAQYINDGVEKFGRYFRRKGWFGFSQEHGEAEIHVDGSTVSQGSGRGTRIIVEVATAYAITKALLPMRVILSVWATPWFARIGGRFGNLLRKKSTSSASSRAAGTNSTGGGVQ